MLFYLILFNLILFYLFYFVLFSFFFFLFYTSIFSINCGILTNRKWNYLHMTVLPRDFVFCSLTLVEVGHTFILSDFYLILFYLTLFFFILFRFILKFFYRFNSIFDFIFPHFFSSSFSSILFICRVWYSFLSYLILFFVYIILVF